MQIMQPLLLYGNVQYFSNKDKWCHCQVKRKLVNLSKGSHRQYKHPNKPGRVTIAGHSGDDLAPGTLNSILKQAQLKMES